MAAGTTQTGRSTRAGATSGTPTSSAAAGGSGGWATTTGADVADVAGAGSGRCRGAGRLRVRRTGGGRIRSRRGGCRGRSDGGSGRDGPRHDQRPAGEDQVRVRERATLEVAATVGLPQLGPPVGVAVAARRHRRQRVALLDDDGARSGFHRYGAGSGGLGLVHGGVDRQGQHPTRAQDFGGLGERPRRAPPPGPRWPGGCRPTARHGRASARRCPRACRGAAPSTSARPPAPTPAPARRGPATTAGSGAADGHRHGPQRRERGGVGRRDEHGHAGDEAGGEAPHRAARRHEAQIAPADQPGHLGQHAGGQLGPRHPQHARHDLHDGAVGHAGTGEGVGHRVRRRQRRGQRPPDERDEPDRDADHEGDEPHQRGQAPHHVADRPAVPLRSRPQPPPNGAAERVAVTDFDPMPNAPSTTVDARDGDRDRDLVGGGRHRAGGPGLRHVRLGHRRRPGRIDGGPAGGEVGERQLLAAAPRRRRGDGTGRAAGGQDPAAVDGQTRRRRRGRRRSAAVNGSTLPGRPVSPPRYASITSVAVASNVRVPPIGRSDSPASDASQRTRTETVSTPPPAKLTSGGARTSDRRRRAGSRPTRRRPPRHGSAPRWRRAPPTRRPIARPAPPVPSARTGRRTRAGQEHRRDERELRAR